MKIRTKVMGLVVTLFVVLAVAQLLVQRQVLLPSFAAIERQSAKTNMERANNAIRREIELLRVSALNWGDWADSYQFMQDRNQTFVKNNLYPALIHSLKIDAVALIGMDGNFAWSGAYDPDSGEPTDIGLVAGGKLPADPLLQSALRAGTPVVGLTRTNRGAMLTVLSPVLDGRGHGPPRGAVLIGRLLTDSEIARIGEQAQSKLTQAILPIAGFAAPAALPPNAILDGPDVLVAFPNVMDVYRTLDDVYGQPLVRLRSEIPRTISASGRDAVASALIFLLVAGAVVLVVLLAALNRTILSPLGRITRHAVAIGEQDDRPERLHLQRSDELGTLAREFERMMDRLQAARRELVDQSFESGIAEMASGALHNIGNTMTPLAVEVAALQERLRKAPTADVHLVVAELDRATDDERRNANLVHFLRLTSLELAALLQSAEGDIATIARQTQAVQDALAEQRNYKRTGAIEETISLEELIAHCAEILPAAVRQRLLIEMDPSVNTIGGLRLARTTLQQVLQNLFINAAEAIKDAGRDRGALRISAAIVAGNLREELHLSLQDEGVGIAAENLVRIFERGFTTKSPETNSGIGLHWCANALNALGGSIRAASAGPGRGACLHVVMPVDRPATRSLAEVA